VAEGEETYRRWRLPRCGSEKGSRLWTDIIVDAVDGHPWRVPGVVFGGEYEQGLISGRGVVNSGLVSAGFHRRGFEDRKKSKRWRSQTFHVEDRVKLRGDELHTCTTWMAMVSSSAMV
jgi:hypothetical protein